METVNYAEGDTCGFTRGKKYLSQENRRKGRGYRNKGEARKFHEVLLYLSELLSIKVNFVRDFTLVGNFSKVSLELFRFVVFLTFYIIPVPKTCPP